MLANETARAHVESVHPDSSSASTTLARGPAPPVHAVFPSHACFAVPRTFIWPSGGVLAAPRCRKGRQGKT